MANATASANGEAKDKVRPVHEIRFGRLRAAIWENQTANGLRHNVVMTRIYKDGDKWKNSASFGRDDLPLVAKVADLAHTWIFEHGAASSERSSGEGAGDDQF